VLAFSNAAHDRQSPNIWQHSSNTIKSKSMVNVMRFEYAVICWLQLTSEADKLQSDAVTMTDCHDNFSD
jgi:hypothetical protein